VTESLFHELNATRTFALRSLEAMQQYLAMEPRLAGREGRERLLALWPRLQGRMGEALDDEAARELQRPLFERALAYHDVTAWVCASDGPGVQALEFLAERGKRVPQDISVVGFDDSQDAFASGLTSYNFNAQSVVRVMVAHVLDPARALPGRRATGITEIEGYVTVRRSTARR
jgi:DNA-binding LacI/PurR family transcriptional regulator